MKTPKKPSKEALLRDKLADLTARLKNSEEIASKRQEFIERIHAIVRPVHSTSYSYSNEQAFKDIFDAVMYLRANEGAIRECWNFMVEQREIIRWLIKPSTAEQTKELDEYKKKFGHGIN